MYLCLISSLSNWISFMWGLSQYQGIEEQKRQGLLHLSYLILYVVIVLLLLFLMVSNRTKQSMLYGTCFTHSSISVVSILHLGQLFILWEFCGHILNIPSIAMSFLGSPEVTICTTKRDETLFLLPILLVFTSGGDHSASPSLTVSLN